MIKLRFVNGIFTFFLLASFVFIPSCGKNSNNNKSIMFTSDNPNIGENTIYFVQGQVSDDTVELLLMASNIIVDRAYGLAFDIDFEPSILQYLSFSEGSYLEDKGKVKVNYLAALQSNDKSKLVVGISQLGRKAGVEGTGIIASFKFRALKEGSSKLTFSNNLIKNPAIQTISGISWVGGFIRIKF